MAGFKRTLTVSYGIVQAVCDLTSTKVPESKDTGLAQVCVGAAHSKAHAPVKPVWDPYCPSCAKTVGRTSLSKATEPVKGQFVVISQEEVADLKGDDANYKGVLALTAHEAAQFEASTMPDGTTYYLAPNPKDAFYGLLRQMIQENPDLAFVGKYTVQSRAATYQVRPYGDLLVAVKMLAPEEMVQAPTVTPREISQAMLDMAPTVARGFITPYDPASYADTYKARLAETMAQRVSEPGAALATGVPSGPAVDPMAAMQAQMEALTAAAGNGSVASAGDGQKPKRTRKKAAA